MEKEALRAALDAISRNPEQEKMHRAATDIHGQKAISDLRELINSNFATLDLSDKSEEEEQDAVDQQECLLTPEEAEKTLQTFESRFKENTHLHEGANWNDVKASLEADPEKLWSIAQMEAAGHVPDVYDEDDTAWYIVTCSEESPESARNCVFDKEAADWLRENYPDVEFNGSAMEMAEAMGIELMSPEHYKEKLQRKGRFDNETWSWLKTDPDTRRSGFAFFGNRFGDVVRVILHDAYRRDDCGAWRGSLRVKKVSA